MVCELPFVIIGAVSATVAVALILHDRRKGKELASKSFKMEYSLLDNRRPLYDDTEVIAGQIFNDVKDGWYTTEKPLLLKPNSGYSIYLQLIPKTSCGISHIDLRFLDEADSPFANDTERPEVEELQDINFQSQGFAKYASRRAKGMTMTYSNRDLPANGGGGE